jgi:hypothetical protein
LWRDSAPGGNVVFVRQRTLEQVIILVVVSLVTAQSAEAQPDFAARVDAVANCYAQLDYSCVLDVLGDFSVQEASASHPRALVELAGRLLAITYIVRDVPERARAIFLELLRAYPDYDLDTSDLAPRFVRVFDEARAMVASGWVTADMEAFAALIAVAQHTVNQGAALARSIAVEAQAITRWTRPTDPHDVQTGLRIRIGAAFANFAGNDSDVFDSGLGFSARIATERLNVFFLELSFDHQSHVVLLDNLVEEVLSDLTVIDVALSVGYPIQIGSVSINPSLGAGYSAFGFEDAFERGGLILEAAVEIGVSFSRFYGLSAEIRPRQIFVEAADGIVVSSPLFFGLYATFDLSVD